MEPEDEGRLPARAAEPEGEVGLSSDSVSGARDSSARGEQWPLGPQQVEVPWVWCFFSSMI
jgi:hypothetical protein